MINIIIIRTELHWISTYLYFTFISSQEGRIVWNYYYYLHVHKQELSWVVITTIITITIIIDLC
jgi:hypothetical protein